MGFGCQEYKKQSGSIWSYRGEYVQGKYARGVLARGVLLPIIFGATVESTRKKSTRQRNTPTHHILELLWGVRAEGVLAGEVLAAGAPHVSSKNDSSGEHSLCTYFPCAYSPTVAPKYDGWGVLLQRALPLHVLPLRELLTSLRF